MVSRVCRLLLQFPCLQVGIELFYTTPTYTSTSFKQIRSPFYKEAIRAMTRLDALKKVTDVRDEKFFYNPILQTVITKPFISVITVKQTKFSLMVSF